MGQSESDQTRRTTDPLALARGDMSRRLPRRFFQHASVGVTDDLYCLLLDGKHAHTPQRHRLCFRSRPLADMVAAEWHSQGNVLNPVTMPITRIAQTGLDFVAPNPGAIQADIVRYAASDLVCYRAPGPAPLVRAQAEAWDPIVDWACSRLQAHFILAEGIVYVAQPKLALDRVRAAVADFGDCVALAALATMTTLSG
jgi:chaperone required for assembly of F1-ATPase